MGIFNYMREPGKLDPFTACQPCQTFDYAKKAYKPGNSIKGYQPEKIKGKQLVTIPKIYTDIANQATHLLIAGATGSGKSVALHGILTAILTKQPLPYLYLIDLKRVELNKYKRLYVTEEYANTAEKAMDTLQAVRDLMLSRYRTMERKGQVKTAGRAVYLIIEEYAELMIQTRKACIPIIQSILQLGRAANVHCFLVTQCPLSKIINTEIKVNIDSILALRTRSAQDSRNIIGCKGCETFPRYGKGMFYSPDLLSPVIVDLPLVPPETEKAILKAL